MKSFPITLPPELNTYIDVETEGRDAILQQAHGFLSSQLDGFIGITHNDPTITVSVQDSSPEDAESIAIALNTLRTALGV